MSIKILDNVDSSEIQELRAELTSKRNIGNVVLEIKQISSDINLEKTEDLPGIIDLFVSKMGCVGIGDRWKEIPQAAAKKIIEYVLTKDLAYSAKIMPVEEAEKLATKMFKIFPNPCKFFTNAVFINNYSALSAWDSLTEATFDTGVIIVNPTMMGILWFTDED